jgi:hypothetical protein
MESPRQLMGALMDISPSAQRYDNTNGDVQQDKI